MLRPLAQQEMSKCAPVSTQLISDLTGLGAQNPNQRHTCSLGDDHSRRTGATTLSKVCLLVQGNQTAHLSLTSKQKITRVLKFLRLFQPPPSVPVIPSLGNGEKGETGTEGAGADSGCETLRPTFFIPSYYRLQRVLWSERGMCVASVTHSVHRRLLRSRPCHEDVRPVSLRCK